MWNRGREKQKEEAEQKEAQFLVLGKAKKDGGGTLSFLPPPQQSREEVQQRLIMSQGPAHSGLNDMLCATTLRHTMDLYSLEPMPIQLENLR
ncbi:hypothetical protein SUGI_0142040 [Cryptomeria japonica]|nr:hypothetical protein SUGI_0142040 [Cryptomeria japonica]